MAMTDMRGLYQRAAGTFGARVRAVREDQWDHPTPCSEWDVRALVNHLVSEQLWVPPLLEGLTVEQVGGRYDGDVLGDDPKRAWQAASSAAVAAFDPPDALERNVHLSFGDVPGEEYCFELTSDLLIHGWDLARAIGADETLDPETTELSLRRLEPIEEVLRGSGLVGPKVDTPPDASPTVKLLGLWGRRA